MADQSRLKLKYGRNKSLATIIRPPIEIAHFIIHGSGILWEDLRFLKLKTNSKCVNLPRAQNHHSDWSRYEGWNCWAGYFCLFCIFFALKRFIPPYFRNRGWNLPDTFPFVSGTFWQGRVFTLKIKVPFFFCLLK